MQGNMLDFEEGWSKMIADLKESKSKTYDTIEGRKKFTIHCSNSKIIFQSPYEGCIISELEMRKVYNRLVEKGSWKTNDYTDITVHASYFLRSLKEYFLK